MKRIRKAGAAAVLLSVLFGCSPGSEEKAPQATCQRITNVEISQVEPQQFIESIELYGTAKPWREVALAAQNAGTVEKLYADKGDRVEAGTVLAEIDASMITAQLSEVRALLKMASSDYEKSEKLFEKKAITRQQFIAAQSSYEAAEAKLKQIEILSDRARVKAPVTGIVVERFLEVGEYAGSGERLFIVHQDDPMKIEAGLPEIDISYFNEGTEAEVRCDALPDETFIGRIARISPAVNEATQTVTLEIAVDNAAKRIRSGMSGRVKLIKRIYHDAVVIPQSAVLDTPDGQTVFVFRDGKAILRQVRTGAIRDEYTLVTAGLSIGEQIIVVGQRNLIDGETVRLIRNGASGS
ncbi:efflux RND transporter periplasmic adaptor subunit [bacterium]|nr:efflux RND transporter periplasmic adaptor subunit [candidate division CSSED10-310 bacterium]